MTYNFYKKLCLTSLLTLSSALPIFAQTQEEGKTYKADEVVVTATLSELRIADVPASVQVFDEAEIADMGSQTLNDVLFEAQGLILEPTNGRLSTARLRGLSSKNTLILMDGMRLPSGFQDYIDLGEIPTGMIGQVEVVRGSGSALYGSDAIGGVINLITRKPQDEFHLNLNTRYGQSTYGEAENPIFKGNMSGGAGDFNYVLSGTFNQRDRFDRDKSTLATDGDDKTIGSGSGKLIYQLTSQSDISFGLNYTDIELEGYRTQTSGDWARTVNATRSSGYVQFSGNLGEKSRLVARAYRSYYDWEAVMKSVSGSSSSTTTSLEQTLDQFDSRWTGLLFDQHRVTAGLEYRNEDRKDDSTSHNVHNLGVFLQDELLFFQRLGVIVGARYDHHSDFGSAISPKLSASYPLTEHIRLRGSYGEGFRAPTVYELYTGSLYTKKKIVYANPNLDPEKSQSYELGADFWYGRISFNLSLFHNDMRDMITEIQTGTNGKIPVYELRNVSKAMTEGMETNIEINLPFGFALGDEFTWMNTENKSTGEELLYVPTTSNTLKLSYHNQEYGLKSNLRVVSIGEQLIESDNVADGYTIFNFYAAKTLSNNFDFYFGIDNLFNSDASSAYGNIGGAGTTGTFFYSGLNFKL
ncbi:TonB-dependent receptor [Chloroherpeton thalassium ATCC 35110]|uniref:TonB-dependent receptor n=1 Tax=Chloroherpeton thalassium (strain ATCC 35110 / GB-78) TaxID=517418 RepID=B3QW50_CHLT3|nr:TonB-dependent receptor [Chloroherpeton thalassium]ACF14704.1 TonB-dependent receptor [Chloroherpeton thalassium ATCC 35110]